MTYYGKQAFETLKQNNFTPKKRFGQNFLVRRATAEAIVAAGEITPGETVVEVGVGLGALTLPLAETAKRVCGFEIDSGLVRFHQETGSLPKNVSVIHENFLHARLNEVCASCGNPIGDGRKKLKIIANLPYSISNPFIFKLIDNAPLIDKATVMLQHEVALRLIAEPGSGEYGVPTVLLASCATVAQKLLLKPAEFYPQPKIDSLVITIDFNRTPLAIPPPETFSYPLLKEVVRTTFNQRRKTISNTLANLPTLHRTGKEKAEIKRCVLKALERAGISPMLRPEVLAPERFIALSQAIATVIA